MTDHFREWHPNFGMYWLSLYNAPNLCILIGISLNAWRTLYPPELYGASPTTNPELIQGPIKGPP